jgi:hypothetical protein
MEKITGSFRFVAARAQEVVRGLVQPHAAKTSGMGILEEHWIRGLT